MGEVFINSTIQKHLYHVLTISHYIISFLMPFINIHTHYITHQEDEISILNVFMDTFSPQTICAYHSVGLHPWHLSNYSPQTNEQILQDTFAHFEAFAVGETGLDKTIATPFAYQQEIFTRHCEFAHEMRKPLIIHCVRAYSEVLAIHKKIKPQNPWLMHGFQTNEIVAQAYIEKGIFLSFGKSLWKGHTPTWKAFLQVPDTLFFLETDDACDFSIQDLYQKAAIGRKIEVESLKKQLYHNFLALF